MGRYQNISVDGYRLKHIYRYVEVLCFVTVINVIKKYLYY